MHGAVMARTAAPEVSLRVGGDEPRLARVTNPHDTRLNLGRHDWTLECWLWLEPGATDEGVIFEIGAGPPGGSRLVTRWSVMPAEAAFVMTGLVPVAPGTEDGLGETIEFTDPGGPPHRRVRPDSVTLAAGRPLPRGRWFHVAFVHEAEAATLRLLLDGRGAAVAVARFEALPRSAAAYVALGCDGRRERPLAGALDELRVYDEVVYRREFVPAEGEGAWPGAAKRGAGLRISVRAHGGDTVGGRCHHSSIADSGSMIPVALECVQWAVQRLFSGNIARMRSVAWVKFRGVFCDRTALAEAVSLGGAIEGAVAALWHEHCIGIASLL